MKKFYIKKEESQEKTLVVFPLYRRHTLMDLGQESTTQADTDESQKPRKYASRSHSIDSLDKKGSPDSITLSTASTVIITESELSSSWLYKNRKAAIATPVKVEQKSTEMSATSSNVDQPTVLDDPKMIPVPVPTKPRPEKCSSRCCYVTVLIIITLCTLGILSIIGSVIYLELFAAYKTTGETPVEEKPLMKGAAILRQPNTNAQILKKSSDIPVSFGNRPFGEKPDNDGRSISENDTDDKQNKSTIQTFLDDISSRITTTLKSQGIIDQSSAQLTEDLTQLKDKLLLSAEETWNASQNLMADIASLFRQKSDSSSHESTSPVSQVEEDLRELSELPGKMLDGFIGRPLGPFPSFNFIPFDMKSDRVQRTGLVGTTSKIRNSKITPSTSPFPSTPRLEITHPISAEITPVQVGDDTSLGKTGIPAMTITPSLEHYEVSFTEKLDVSVDSTEETPDLPIAKIRSESAEMPVSSSKTVEVVVPNGQINKINAVEQSVDTFDEPESISLTPEAPINEVSASESQSSIFESITNVTGSLSELSTIKINEPVLIERVVPTKVQKTAQLESHTVTTHQPSTSLKIPLDIKSSLAEAMKHLLSLDVNRNVPSSRSKSSGAVKSNATRLVNKMIGPVVKPNPEVNTTHPEEKSERMRYLQKLRSIMFKNG